MARVGIIGTGWGARVQIPAFRTAGLEVVAVAGSDPEKTRRVAAEHSVRGHDDWRRLVESPDVDLVSIVTPPDQHAEMAIRALEAGKHVLSEKPTALSAAEAERMLAAAQARPKQLALIDHELRFLPSWREARARIGELGALRYAELRYSSPGRADPQRPWNWWSDAARGGGVWGAVGSHFVDALRYFVGEIEAVAASLQTFIRERPFGDGKRRVTSDDFAAAHVWLEEGAFVVMTFSVVAAVDEPTTLTLVGANGAFRLVADELRSARTGQEWRAETTQGGARVVGDSSGGFFGTGTVWLGRALAAALDRGEREALAPAATFRDGLAQQRALDAGRRSSENGSRREAVGRG